MNDCLRSCLTGVSALARSVLRDFPLSKRTAGTGIVVAVAALLAFPAASYSQGQGEKKPPAPSSEEAALQFTDATNLQNAGKYGLAADEYVDFIKRFPEDPYIPRAWHYLSVCNLKQEKYDETVAAAQKALAAGGANFDLAAESYLFLGLAHYHLGQNSKDAAARGDHLTKAAAALGTVATKFAKSPHAPQALYYNAEAHYAAGRKAEAVKAYEMLIDEHPKSELVPSALYGLGFALEELGDPAAAGKAYDKFLKDYATHDLAADVTLRRGETLLAQKQFAEAKPLFAKAAAIEGFAQADQALLQQASCAYELKEFDEAATLYLQIPKRFPQSPQAANAQMNAGKALLLVEKFPEARAAMAVLLGAENKDLAAEAAHLTARCLLREKNPAAAAAVADKALAAAKGGKWEPQLLLDRADATFDQDDKHKQAVDAYLALVQAYPEHPLAADGRFMAAYASLKADDPKQAQALAAEFLKRHAEHTLVAEAAAVLAESNLLLRDFAAAEKQFRDLIAKYGDHRDKPQWQRRLGYTLLLADKHAAAIEQLAPLVAGTKDPEALADVQYWIATSQI
ncbi:MAG: tetratricopeptide repeat protein, partial [Pirellulales bacterium]